MHPNARSLSWGHVLARVELPRARLKLPRARVELPRAPDSPGPCFFLYTFLISHSLLPSFPPQQHHPTRLPT